MEIKEIHRTLANGIIQRNHYSHTIVVGTKVSLGVFVDDQLLGVLQLGKGVHPSATAKHVQGTEMHQYLELNRMWLSDLLPHNSESKAIGLMFKWIKKNMPEIKWLISFADGIEGNCGTIYQASNWIYTGFNKSGGMYVTEDGRKMHIHKASHNLENCKHSTLEAKWGPLIRVAGGQFRYFYFLDKKWKNRLNLQILSYPKASNMKDYLLIYDNKGRCPDGFYELQRRLEGYQSMIDLIES